MPDRPKLMSSYTVEDTIRFNRMINDMLDDGDITYREADMINDEFVKLQKGAREALDKTLERYGITQKYAPEIDIRKRNITFVLIVAIPVLAAVGKIILTLSR